MKERGKEKEKGKGERRSGRGKEKEKEGGEQEREGGGRGGEMSTSKEADGLAAESRFLGMLHTHWRLN